MQNFKSLPLFATLLGICYRIGYEGDSCPWCGCGLHIVVRRVSFLSCTTKICPNYYNGVLDTRIEYKHGKIPRFDFHGGVIGVDDYTETKDDEKC